jgi:alpha-galactosidase
MTLTWILMVLALLGALPPPASAAVKLQREGGDLQIAAPRLRIECDLTTGRCTYRWPGGSAIRGAACAARLAGGSEISTPDYARHEFAARDASPVQDAFGRGLQVVVHHRAAGRPELRQRFRVCEDQPFCFVDMEIVHPTPLSSNSIAPLVCDPARVPGAGAHLDAGDQPRSLFVPFDNDMFVRYNSEYATNSHEVTALYDNASRRGFVVGSVSHDLWKTGLTMGGFGRRTVGDLRVFGGMTGKWTHDSQPHGFVSGTTVPSPRIFVGFFTDWRDGMEAYGRANAALAPPLRWDGGVPFGWNSWAAYRENVSFDRYMAAAAFFKDQLQPRGFHNEGRAYLNLDSFWDRLTPEQLAEAARRIHANGQMAGIYWTPFTFWGDDLDRKVEGTHDRYTYEELLLKDASGKPLPKLDGGRALDPSHPGTLQRIDWQLGRFVKWGFDFVKLDFINAGALEGAHHDPRIPTGIAAYNLGMKRIVAAVAPRKIGRPFFISLSIAPLFPSGYAHSRRMSCDAFGSLEDTEYMLNSLTYGWWTHGTLYRFNDPDHIVLAASEAEARTRFHSAAIAGTVLLDSDDLTNPAVQERALKVLTNPAINALARSGRTFRPVEGDTGGRAGDVFVREDAGAFLIAVFNFDGRRPVEKELDLGRLGLDPTASYRVRDLWTQQVSSARGTLRIGLAPAESTIVRLDVE